MDIATVRSAGEGELLTPMTAASANAHWRRPDYGWTHSAPVEGFFVVLTIVIVPVAIMRWLRRLRSVWFAEIGWNRRDAGS